MAIWFFRCNFLYSLWHIHMTIFYIVCLCIVEITIWNLFYCNRIRINAFGTIWRCFSSTWPLRPLSHAFHITDFRYANTRIFRCTVGDIHNKWSDLFQIFIFHQKIQSCNSVVVSNITTLSALIYTVGSVYPFKFFLNIRQIYYSSVQITSVIIRLQVLESIVENF